MAELLTVTLVVSACSLLYELIVAQTLSLLAGNTVVWYSLTVGVYLGGMGLGAALLAPRFRGGAWRALFGVEILLSAVGAAAPLLIHLAHSLHLFLTPVAAGASHLLFFGVSLAMTSLVGLLSGVELPLLIRIGGSLEGGGLTNRVLGWDYLGALVAGLLFPLALVPLLSLPVIGFATALTNLSVAAYVLRRRVPRDGWTLERSLVTAVLGILLLLGLARGGSVEQYFLKRYYFHLQAADRGTPFGALDDLPTVTRAQSPYQKINLVNDPSGYPTDVLLEAYSSKWRDHPDFPRNEFLFLNGDFQVSSNHEEAYHEWFAHVPVILNGEAPRRVLVMGAGDGLLMRELVKYDDVRSITHVDLDRALLGLAKSHPVLTAMNQGALEDPRIETRFGDAFQYLRRSHETFDAIYLDFPYAMDYNLSKLYSREFFHFVLQRLSEGGYAVLDAPGMDFREEADGDGGASTMGVGDWDIYLSTLRAAGFETIVPYRAAVEDDNPEAFALLEDWEGTPDFVDPRTGSVDATLRREWMRRTVARHALNYGETFIFLGRGAAPAVAYRDPGVEMAVLNETRFGLSFPFRPPSGGEARPRWVNSILRPTLPTVRIWSVRRPWN